MDQDKMDRWLAEGRKAMQKAAPELSMKGPTIEHAMTHILAVGYRAVIRAAISDIAGEMLGKMIHDLKVIPTDGGPSLRVFHQGGAVSKTAVRRFIQ